MPLFRADDGVRLVYLDEGKGTPLVFVHGWMMSGNSFRRQVDAFRDTHRVLVPDLRGCGGSDAKAGTHNVPRYAADLEQLLEHAHADDPVIVGWSMGGGIAMHAAQNRGMKHIRGIGLIDFPPRIGIDAQEADKVCRSLVERRAEFSRKFMHRMFTAAPPEADIERMLAESAKCRPDTACEMYQAMRPSNLPDTVGPYDVPAFLAFPENGWFPQSLAEWKNIFPRHEAPSFQSSRHCPFLEEADAFNGSLRHFLGRSW